MAVEQVEGVSIALSAGIFTGCCGVLRPLMAVERL